MKVRDTHVYVRGTVPTTERREVISVVLADALPDCEVHNELTLVESAGAHRGGAAVVIRVAAVGDVHVGVDSAGTLRPELSHLAASARRAAARGRPHPHRHPRGGARPRRRARRAPVPDRRGARQPRPPLRRGDDGRGGARTGRRARCSRASAPSLAVAGGHGSGSPAPRASAAASPVRAATEFGEPEMKAFIASHAGTWRSACTTPRRRSTPTSASRSSTTRRCDDTLEGERLEIFPFLGSYLLAEAIDAAGADLVRPRPRARRDRERRHARRASTCATSPSR